MEQQDHRVFAAHSSLGWSAGELGRFEITKPFLECKNAVPTMEPQPLKAVEKCTAVSPRKAPSVIKTKPLPTQKPVAKAKAPAPPKTLEKSSQPWRVSVRMAVFLLVALLAMTCAAFGMVDATSLASAPRRPARSSRQHHGRPRHGFFLQPCWHLLRSSQ
jgi:hypothetical protein